MVELLLDLGADVSALSLDGLGPLKLALVYGYESIVRLLLERDVSAPARAEGWTGLHLATFLGDESSVRTELEHGADTNSKDKNGMTALHWAVVQGYENVVPLLLEYNADVAAKDHEGQTALHRAVSKKNEKIVRALLLGGSERNATDLHGWTPSHVARMYGNDNMRDVILEGNGNSMSETPIAEAPSRWVTTEESLGITITKDGLTAMTGKIGLLPFSNLARPDECLTQKTAVHQN